MIQICDFLGNLIYVTCFLCIGSYFFEYQRRNQKYEKLLLLLIILVTTFLWSFNIWGLKLIIHALSVIMTMRIFFKEKWNHLFGFYVGIMAVIGMLSEMFIMIVNSITELCKISCPDKIMNLIAELLLLTYIWGCGIYFKKRYAGALKKIGTRYYLFFICILFMDATITIPLQWAIADAETKRKGLLILIFISVVIGLLLQIVLLMNALVTRSVFKEKERLARQFLESQNEHYLYLEKREESTKKFRHDIRNHITLLQHFMNNQEYGKAEEYLDVMNEKVEAFGNHISVHNGIADAILNKFHSEAEEKGIELRVRGHFPMECHIVAYDICTVLSNLLSNALLAEYQCSGDAVEVAIRYTEDELYLQVENDYAHELQVSNGEFRTTKTDVGHGYGLANVRECVEKNGGHMTISTENQRFKVMLCMRNEKEE